MSIHPIVIKFGGTSLGSPARIRRAARRVAAHVRRGRPTVHVEFDEATAMLAGDATRARDLGVRTAADHLPCRPVPLGERSGIQSGHLTCAIQCSDSANTMRPSWTSK